MTAMHAVLIGLYHFPPFRWGHQQICGEVPVDPTLVLMSRTAEYGNYVQNRGNSLTCGQGPTHPEDVASTIKGQEGWEGNVYIKRTNLLPSNYLGKIIGITPLPGFSY